VRDGRCARGNTHEYTLVPTNPKTHTAHTEVTGQVSGLTLASLMHVRALAEVWRAESLVML
jgi:uroporphyrinogen-III synthase